MVRPIEREGFISLLQAAALARRFDFTRQVATEWLAVWPGDSEVRLQLARSELDLGLLRPAVDRLEQVVAADPECVEAYELLIRAQRQSGDAIRPATYEACLAVLTGGSSDWASLPPWALPAYRAVGALDQGGSAEAIAGVREALACDPSSPLPSLIGLKAYLAAGESAAAAGLAQASRKRWPTCIGFRLMVAIAGLGGDRRASSVAELHRLAAADPVGLVVESMLGPGHPYRALWPGRMEAVLSRPIPSEVAALLGKTALADPGPQPAQPPSAAQPAAPHSLRKMPTPEPGENFQGPNPGEAPPRATPSETLLSVRRELDRLDQRLRGHQPGSPRDQRVPAYIVLSSHTRLVQQLGQPAFARIDEAIGVLVEAVRRRRSWQAYRFYPDDPKVLAPFGLTPCDPGNAWQIKLRLADLDQALRGRGEMVGAVLIVGGQQIVPFHELPNPTDDDDELVPSDNPYGTSDENYFAPEWPVGRLPADDDPDLLVSALKNSAAAHRHSGRTFGGFGVWIRDRFGRLMRPEATAIGYSASIWRKASLAVFRTIGGPRSLATSPPAHAEAMPASFGRPSSLSYFNLHGLEDAPEWFGQRDPLRDRTAATEFPIALRPQDVVDGGRAPKVVFTEACYGAHVIGKTRDTALSLKFLSSGSHAVIGSTKISYGAIAPPLIAADLIGKLFWDELRRGTPVGEALRRAKLQLAAEMHARQGYLDGEDQKTLISFVLYGDPLFSMDHSGRPAAIKNLSRSLDRPAAVKTACALGGPDLLNAEAGTDKVREVVAKYLPTMADAECRLRTQHWGCSDPDHACPSQQLGAKAVGAGEVYVLTLDKRVVGGAQLHPRYARLTMDKSGKLLKLAISR